MILIAHRGNTDGPKSELENTPDYIDKAISEGYYVEVDVWIENNNFYLGHDAPEHPISKTFLEKRKERLFCHAKNIDALYHLLFINDLVVFSHDKDPVVLTSNRLLWHFPSKNIQLTHNSIFVMPEFVYSIDETKDFLKNKYIYGICSDYVSSFKTI